MKSATREIVINTGPVITLAAATNTLLWLTSLYQNVSMPHEVFQNLSAGRRLAPEPAFVLASGPCNHRLPRLEGLPLSAFSSLRGFSPLREVLFRLSL